MSKLDRSVWSSIAVSYYRLPNETVPEPGEMVCLSPLHLECKTDGHYKFWEGLVVLSAGPSNSSSQVQIRFGKIGATGSSQSKIFFSQDRAVGFLDKKLKEKLKKGYNRVSRPDTCKGMLQAERSQTFILVEYDETGTIASLLTEQGLPYYVWACQIRSLFSEVG